MTKAELESKHLAELHTLAAEAGVPSYRMLRREELIEKLSGGGNGGPRREKPSRQGDRPQRQRRERGGRERRPRERAERPAREPEAERPARGPAPEPVPAEPTPAPRAEAPAPKRKRRRRRFGRRSKSLRIQDLLTPPPGRQSLVQAESRESCTAMLREIAAEVAESSIALLIDPSPEELADWKREAPQAELVVAAQPRHASDALAQAVRRAEGGEHVTLLVDSLSRLEDTDVAREIFDGGLGLAAASGSLTIVAALERS